MIDPRLTELARILVEECVSTQSGEHIWVRATSPASLPLAREVYKQILRCGAHPLYDINDDMIATFFYKHATPEQLNHHPDVMEFIANLADKTITIIGEHNTRELSGTDPKKLMARSRLIRPVKEIIMAKPWTLTYMPTAAMAQDANMSLEDFEDFFFGATNRNWKEVERAMKKLADRLSQAKVLRIVGERTDLTMKVGGKTWIYDDWKANMPGGEVFTSPVANSVEGEVFFGYPVPHHGSLIRNIHLVFKEGRVVEAHASENQALLDEILATDADSCRLGEIALGGNPGITTYMHNTLFDEKMAGTLHMALGQGFAECGGETTSAVHMDMVKEMRQAGTRIELDGVPFLVDGKIVHS